MAHAPPPAAGAADALSWVELASWFLLGASGWWGINAVSAEAPYFVDALPEAERIGNLIAVMTQVGNAAPILYRLAPRRPEACLFQVIGLLQAAATGVLGFCCLLWSLTLGGMSLPLLGLTAALGCVGCMSNVTYWAYAVPFPASCTKALSLGMALGGLGSSLLVAAQMGNRPPGEPRFGASAYLALASVAQGLTLLAFLATSRARRGVAPGDGGAGSAGPGGAAVIGRRRTLQAEGPPEEDDELDALHGGGGEDIEGVEGFDSNDELLATSASVAEKCASTGAQPPNLRAPILCGTFVLYASTYTLPTFLPYLARNYAAAAGQERQKQQLLLRMLVAQTVGDVGGRLCTMLAPSDMDASKQYSVQAACAGALIVSYAVVVLGTYWPWTIVAAAPHGVALWLLPLDVLAFNFARGFVVTFIYLFVRSAWRDVESATRVSGDVGFCGQMGALSANLVLLVITSLFAT